MKLSIVVPYLSRSKAFPICKEHIYKNTINEFEIVEVVNSRDVYGAYNTGAAKANGDILVMIGDDMFFSKGWDEYIVKYIKPYTIVFTHLIEKEAGQLHNFNILQDFGDNPENFNSEKFQQFCNYLEDKVPEAIVGQRGWYQPFAVLKSNWVPYPNKIKWPNEHEANDIVLIEKILPLYGFDQVRVRSFAYHLQKYTEKYLLGSPGRDLNEYKQKE